MKDQGFVFEGSGRMGPSSALKRQWKKTRWPKGTGGLVWRDHAEAKSRPDAAGRTGSWQRSARAQFTPGQLNMRTLSPSGEVVEPLAFTLSLPAGRTPTHARQTCSNSRIDGARSRSLRRSTSRQLHESGAESDPRRSMASVSRPVMVRESNWMASKPDLFDPGLRARVCGETWTCTRNFDAPIFE